MLASTASRLARRLIARAPSHVMIASTSRPRCDLPSARAYGQLSDPNTFELLQGPEGRVIFDKYAQTTPRARHARHPRDGIKH